MRYSVVQNQALPRPGQVPVACPVRVSTDTLAAKDRRAFWADVVCSQLVRAEVRALESPTCTLPPRPFLGQLDRFDLSGVEVCRIEADPQQVQRTPAQAQSAEEERLILVQQAQGRSRVTQSGREAELRPGDMAAFSSANPYTLEFDQPFVQYVFILPMREVRQVVGSVQDGLACTWSAPSPGQALLPQMANELLGWSKDAPSWPVALDAIAVQHWHQTILHTVAVVALPHLQRLQPADARKLSAYHRARIHAVIRDHLQDPALSVDFIAAKTRLSVAHIHRLFESEPETVCATVRRLRLEGCQRDLGDPRQAHRAITEIAADWGFFQPAHFSHAFRAFAGCSPREWRRGERPSA